MRSFGRRLALSTFLLALLSGACVRLLEVQGGQGLTPARDHRGLDAPASRHDLSPSDASTRPDRRDQAGTIGKSDRGADRSGEPGVCSAWSSWGCVNGGAADAGTYYCRGRCGPFTLFCDKVSLDCWCNGKWCGKNVGFGEPCNFCESSWNKGACCSN